MDLDKTQLQWLLAGIGVVVVVLIYLWGMRSHIKDSIRNRRRRPEREPALGMTPAPFTTDEAAEVVHDFGDLGRMTSSHHLADKALVDVEIRRINRGPADPLAAQGAAEAEPSPASPTAAAPLRMTVTLTVIAPPHQPFSGSTILATADELDCHLSEDGLFERFPEGSADTGAPIFSLAHLREPGGFEPVSLLELKTPGLLLFMDLPGPLPPSKALNLLVFTADQWARKLGGVICDERRNRLTNQTLNQISRQVSDLEQRLLAQSP